ncbi:MAG: translation initiation factor IF-2 [Parcubacteria group bacterium]|nr:translation initiation factor IF-2 [Parcubacteria group bacterium]
MSPASQKPNIQSGSVPRPPVVVVMGHIDHGKSSLLDYIRKTNVTAGEAGGITQHMYAYEIEHQGEGGGKRKITFIDTPGHAAFSLMRERGAVVADIAILVVAADDGVKAQTVEALKTIRGNNVPFIVALNKIDKEGANSERVKQELAEKEVFVEGYGGDVPLVPISAKRGDGIPELLDMVLLVADMRELTGDPEANAEGIVIEAHRDERVGISATLIIKNGILRKGMYVAIGGSVAPARRVENFLGKTVDEATFSAPVHVYGFAELPSVGATFKASESQEEAIAAANLLKDEVAKTPVSAPRREETAEDVAVVPIIIKADTMGTLEAIEKEVGLLSPERVRPYILGKGIGTVGEADVARALGKEKAIVVAFNTKVERRAEELATREKVSIGTFTIIYELIEWLEKELTKHRPKVMVEDVIGSAKIIRVFSRTKDKQVVGGRVKTGRLTTSKEVRVIRRENTIGHGRILELQQQKQKTNEVLEGVEFGAMIESRHEIAPGDVIEAIERVER